MSTERLGYLLKHAQAQFAELHAQALAPHRISGRELAVLLTLSDSQASSQQQAADRLGIDRTTMVALLDALMQRDLVERRPDPADRRRNVVLLTDLGRQTVDQALVASDEAERQFLSPLDQDTAATLRAALRAVIAGHMSGKVGIMG